MNLVDHLITTLLNCIVKLKCLNDWVLLANFVFESYNFNQGE